MKQKHTILLGLCLTFLLTLSLSVTASANETQHLPITVWKHGRVFLNSQQVTFIKDDQRVPCLAYNGSVYVPAFSIGQWLGRDVSWNPDTNELLFDGESPKVTYDFRDYTGPAQHIEYENITQNIKIFNDVSIVYCDIIFKPTNSNGNKLPLIKLDTVLYMPIRTFCEFNGMSINWVSYGTTQTVYVRDSMSESQQTMIKSYIEDCDMAANSIGEKISTFRATDAMTSQNLLLCLDDIQTAINQMYEIIHPSVEFLNGASESILERLDVLSQNVVDLRRTVRNTNNGVMNLDGINAGGLNIEGNKDLLLSELSFLRDAFWQTGYPF